MGRTQDGEGFHGMLSGYSKALSLSVALVLTACGDDTNTSMSGDGTAGSTSTATTSPTTSNSTTGNSGSTTEGGGTQSGTGSTSLPTTGDTASTGPSTATTGDPTGPVSSTDPMTTTNPTNGSTTDETTSGGTTEAVSGSSGNGSTSNGSNGSTSDSGNPPDTTDGNGVCLPGDMGGMGMVEKSYIWIPSQDSGQISKVNTLTLVEEARYRTGPNGGGESPSRTAVSADGRFVVVNNRSTGRATMIAADKADCVDKNGNGVIDTSMALNDIKAWGQDECMIWSITFPFGGAWQQGPRGVTWSPGEWSFEECKFLNPKVWLGYWSNQGNNTIHVVRIDGETGVVELTLPIPAWNGSGFAPYGAAMDQKFQPWFSSLRGEIARVNVNNNPVDATRFPVPGNVQSYGMTVDRDGNPWTAGWTGPVGVFEVEANKWTTIPGVSNAAHRGIGASDKYVWVASTSPCRLVQIDRKNRTLIAYHTPPQCSTAIGISIDIEGFVWLVDQAGWAWKIDQENVKWDKKVLVAGSHYAYSDMTGGQVRDILPQ